MGEVTRRFALPNILQLREIFSNINTEVDSLYDSLVSHTT